MLCAKRHSAWPNGASNTKKPKTLVNNDEVIVGHSELELMPPDMMLTVMQFLDTEDMNVFAMCSKHCNKVRSSPVLNQTRTGILTITHPVTAYHPLLTAMSRGQWKKHPSHINRTTLVVVGFDNMHVPFYQASGKWSFAWGQCTLEHVSKIIFEPSGIFRNMHQEGLNFFTYALQGLVPNCEEIKLKMFYCLEGTSAAGSLAKRCSELFRKLKKFETVQCDGWPNVYPGFNLDGKQFKKAKNLTELYIDSSVFYEHRKLDRRFWEEDETFQGKDWYLLMKCRAIERLSIKDVYTKYFEIDDDIDEDLFPDSGQWVVEPISQKCLMKFVRFTPTLRWLRSDLTDVNVATLRQLRPDVTFVRE